VYNKVIVPLDGSELAECVLPHVEAIAKGCGVHDVIFVSVVEPVHLYRDVESSSLSDEQRLLEVLRESMVTARSYLDQVASRTRYDGVKVQSEVLTGKVADTIADYATKNEADLIVIATHGRSGVSHWVYGSVADRILRSSCVPVLMVRAPGCIPGI